MPLDPLPTTASLLCFEAVARLRSFTLAARELGVTQGAVSKQVASLEALLAARLFGADRKRKAVLSSSGAAYFPKVQRYIADLRAATAAAGRDEEDRHLRIGVPTTFGSRWLIPRMPDFIAAHPDITLEFATRISGTSRAGGEDLDASIEFAVAPSGDRRWLPIMDWEIVATASSALATKLAPDGSLSGATVLVHESERELWLRWSGGAPERSSGARVLGFEHYAMLFEAAAAGIGVAFAPLPLMEREIASELLVPVAGVRLASANRCYLVSRHDDDRPSLTMFRSWLLDAASKEPAPRDGRVP